MGLLINSFYLVKRMKRVLICVAVLLAMTSCWDFPDPDKYFIELVVHNRTDTDLYVKSYSVSYDPQSEMRCVCPDSFLVICSTYAGNSRYGREYLECDTFWNDSYVRLRGVHVYMDPDSPPVKKWHYDDSNSEPHDLFNRYDWILLPDEKMKSGMIKRTWIFEILPEDLASLSCQ